MCDKCGNLFSERAEGWGTGQLSVTKTIDGRRRTVTETMDVCPPCNAFDGAPIPSLPALTAVAGPDAADRLADVATVVGNG